MKKIVSITLANNTEEIIGDALRSVVDWVDICLVIDTGISDKTLQVAEEVAGDKLRVLQTTWVNDFAAMRNLALAMASHFGNLGIFVDTDERVVGGSREILDTFQSAVGRLKSFHGNFVVQNDRVFQLPSMKAYYVGPTHECAITDDAVLIEGMTRWELGKTPEQSHAKMLRDKESLIKYSAEHPDDPRWHFYLGDTLNSLGEYIEAVEAFRKCASLPGWAEQGAWACFQAANILIKLERFHEATEIAVRGLQHDPSFGELYWVLGCTAQHTGNYEAAVSWAEQAIRFGLFHGNRSSVYRVCFQFLPALYEAPYDVLRISYDQLGNEEKCDEADVLFTQAQELRLNGEAA